MSTQSISVYRLRDRPGANHAFPQLPRRDSHERPTTARHPGTTCPDGVEAAKGYALNEDVLSFNDAANRDAFVADEEAYMKQYGLERAAEGGDPRAGRCSSSRRRQRLLPGQVRRHLRPGHAGHRRPADRHDQRRIHGQARGRREEQTMATLVGGITTRTSRRSAARSPATCRPNRTGTLLRRLSAHPRLARRRSSRMSRSSSTTTTA